MGKIVSFWRNGKILGKGIESGIADGKIVLQITEVKYHDVVEAVMTTVLKGKERIHHLRKGYFQLTDKHIKN